MEKREPAISVFTWLIYKEVDNISKNEGKTFEDDFKKSVPDTCWIYRLRDNASSFANGDKTRFTTSNICDFILFDDNTNTLSLIECKSTKSTSIPFTMIRENQLKGLLDAYKHNIYAGIIVNFRNENNDTFFIPIHVFEYLKNTISKKSFNIKDLIQLNAIRVCSTKKRTHYKYNITDLIKKVITYDWFGNQRISN